MPKDLKIDLDTKDLVIDNFDFKFTEGNEAVLQEVRIKIQNFLRDWFLNQTTGVPYYESILVKNPNIPQIAAIIRGAVIEVEGVDEVQNVQVNLDPQNRNLNISFDASINNTNEFIQAGVSII